MGHERTHFRRNYDQIDLDKHPREAPWQRKRNRRGIGEKFGWTHGGPLAKFRRWQANMVELEH